MLDNGFPANQSEIFLNLDPADTTKLDFSGGSDKGGGFIEPSTAITALSRKHGAVGRQRHQHRGPRDRPGNVRSGEVHRQRRAETVRSAQSAGHPADRPTAGRGAQAHRQPARLRRASVPAEYANLQLALQKSVKTLQSDVGNPDTPDALEQRSWRLFSLRPTAPCRR